MAFLVSPRVIVTCAHVVNLALGEKPDKTEEPPEDTRLTVTFPLTMDPEPMQARITAWKPMGSGALADVAVLYLDKDAPAEAGIAVLADIQGIPLDGDSLSTFGFANQLRFGSHVDIQFMGPAIGGVTQIDGVSPATAFIERGYSGGAVWSRRHEAVIGMVSARLNDPRSDVRTAFMIPAFALKEAAEPVSLPMEVRRLAREFKSLWTVLAIAWFLLLLNHFLITQGGSPAPFLSLSGDHKQLAAFSGLHIFAFGVPFVYWCLRAHAKALSLHDWSWRVPGLSFIHTRTVKRYRLPLAVLTLILIGLVPLYVQGHFLRKFHNEGTVYAYARDFGYDDVSGMTCISHGQLCVLPGAGRYSLAEIRNNAAGGYWDNRYRYGEDHGGERDTTTFFPILQPVVLEILSALAVLIFVSALNNVFGPWRFLNWFERLFPTRKE